MHNIIVGGKTANAYIESMLNPEPVITEPEETDIGGIAIIQHRVPFPGICLKGIQPNVEIDLLSIFSLQ